LRNLVEEEGDCGVKKKSDISSDESMMRETKGTVMVSKTVMTEMRQMME
jgi:hypothetical protein